MIFLSSIYCKRVPLNFQQWKKILIKVIIPILLEKLQFPQKEDPHRYFGSTDLNGQIIELTKCRRQDRNKKFFRLTFWGHDSHKLALQPRRIFNLLSMISSAEE